jgi:hypothetical protein
MQLYVKLELVLSMEQILSNVLVNVYWKCGTEVSNSIKHLRINYFTVLCARQ